MNQRQKLIQKQFLNNEEAVIKRLKQVYGQSQKDLDHKIKNLTFKIGKLQQEYDWMEPDDPEKAKVKSMIQSKIYQKQYQEQLKKQVDGILNQIQTKSYLTISDYLDDCYTDGFIGTIFDAHGQGVPIITPINQESMVRAVQLDSKISKGLYTKLGEDVNLLKKKITAQVSRSIATGMTYAQTAQQLAGYTNIGFNRSIRIARTEGHRVQTTATMDAMTAAKKKGANVVKQWDAALDARTRDSHVKVDGEIRELNEVFSNGLRYPGDPHGAAAEVINCRCALLQRAKWAVGNEFTKMNNFTKQLETFESPDDYNEFKKGFFSDGNKQYMNYVQKMQDKYGTKDFARVLDKMSDREYEHYSELLKGNPLFNTKPKVDIPEVDPLSFTDEQSEAIRWYVSGEGQFINQYLRGNVGDDFGELSEGEEHLLKQLTEATDRVLPDDVGELFRSVDAKAIFGDIDSDDFWSIQDALAYDDKYAKSKVQSLLDRTTGKTITEKGFMSTSKNYDLANDWGNFTGSDMPVTIEFAKVPKGLKGADLKAFDLEGDEQFEVLLAKGTKYQIDEIYYKNGNVHVKAHFICYESR